jgi:hypothetical protein
VSKYVILIHEDEQSYADASQEVWDEIMKEHETFSEMAGDALLGGEALQPTSTATSIRKDVGGQVTVTDGPFAEVKEALGGYYIVEAADLDAAIAIAQHVPARFGGVEVRPVMVFD